MNLIYDSIVRLLRIVRSRTTNLLGAIVLPAVLANSSVLVADTFQNMEFEAFQPNGDGTVLVDGWMDATGSQLHANRDNGCTDTCYQLLNGQGPGTIEGDSSLFLFGGSLTFITTIFVDGQPFELEEAVDIETWISQDGEIPSDANTVRLLATTPISILVDGIDVPLTPISTDVSGATEYAGDVTSFAGNSVELMIMTHAATIDSLSFSIQAIPEPSALMLFGIAIGIMAAYATRRRRPPIG